jgi:hypothetical protein
VKILQEKCKQKWENYRRTHVDGPPATADLKAREMLKMRSQLPRRETTIATLVRSECIGLRAFLHKRRVSGFDNPACDCGLILHVNRSATWAQVATKAFGN